MRPPVYDWHRIEQDFITDNEPLHNGVTLKTIAEKYDIPYQTVRRKAAADEWHSKRYWLWKYKNTSFGRDYIRRIDRKIARIEARREREYQRNSETNTDNSCNGRDPKNGRFLPGNKIAVGNRGNENPKWRNQNAVKHGLYSGGLLIKAMKDVQLIRKGELSHG